MLLSLVAATSVTTAFWSTLYDTMCQVVGSPPLGENLVSAPLVLRAPVLSSRPAFSSHCCGFPGTSHFLALAVVCSVQWLLFNTRLSVHVWGGVSSACNHGCGVSFLSGLFALRDSTRKHPGKGSHFLPPPVEEEGRGLPLLGRKQTDTPCFRLSFIQTSRGANGPPVGPQCPPPLTGCTTMIVSSHADATATNSVVSIPVMIGDTPVPPQP